MAEKELQKNADSKPVKEKAKKNANAKPGFFKRLATWFKGIKSEFKKVTWASRKSTFRSFGIVLAIVVASAAVISLVDLGLESLFSLLDNLI